MIVSHLEQQQLQGTAYTYYLRCSHMSHSDLHVKAAEKHNKEQTLFLPTARCKQAMLLHALTHGLILLSMSCRIVVALTCAPTIVAFLSAL